MSCAQGRLYTAHIKAIEQFASIGGMLPEQVWDYDDIPSKGMYSGTSGGFGAAAGVGACGVSEAAAVGCGWTGV